VIVVDSSALIAILLGEPRAEACLAMLAESQPLLTSAGTLAESIVVATHRGRLAGLERLIEQFEIEVVPVTADSARRAGAAYARWGKGLHPAVLNFGDCFAYELAESRGCPRLYIGNDFSQPDVISALDATPPHS
jgi:ribonuclease VapC